MASIYKRGKYWWVSYKEGNRRVCRSLKVTNRRAAEVLLAEYQLREAAAQNDSNAILPVGRVAVEALWHEYMNRRVFRKKTKKWYQDHMNAFLRFCRGEGIEFVQDITREHVEDFYLQRRREVSVPTANGSIRALRAVLNYGVHKRYIRTNPVKGIKLEKPTSKVFKRLSREEVRKLLDTAKVHAPSYYPLFATAYYAGLRAGEAIYLSPEDVDYKQEVILVRSKPENPIKDHQERKVPLNRKLKDILQSLNHSGKWLFVTKLGTPRKNNVNRKLKRIAKIAGIDPEKASMQVLRESFGSHLRENGVDIALIKEYMGHSSIDVTLRHYASIKVERTHDAINTL